MNTPINHRQRNRNRMLLVLLVVVFLGSVLVAGLLRFSGWRPEGTRNQGELLQPPADLRGQAPQLAQGGRYAWDPGARLWRVLVAPPTDCGQRCVTLTEELDTVWRLFGRRADHVHILWMGAPPEGAAVNRAWFVLDEDAGIRAALPGLADGDGVPVYVVDPNGFVILRYPPGSDLKGLHTDMSRLLKLK